MPVEMALSVWRSLRALSGARATVHLTGGEPFLYWDRLVEIMAQAHSEGLGPVEMIETNGSWASDLVLVRDRLIQLDRLGMEVLKISCDPFHQAFVPIERVRLLAEVAGEILGPGRVMVRWRQYLDAHTGTDLQSCISSISEHPCRFTGRAAGQLAQAVACRPLDQLRGQGCLPGFLGAKGVHVDPYGNVFSGTCSGIIIGNVQKESLEQIWKGFDPSGPGLVGLIASQGPAGMLDLPQAGGYRPLALYADKCHLCTDIRRYLSRNCPSLPEIGPPDCYQ